MVGREVRGPETETERSRQRAREHVVGVEVGGVDREAVELEPAPLRVHHALRQPRRARGGVEHPQLVAVRARGRPRRAAPAGPEVVAARRQRSRPRRCARAGARPRARRRAARSRRVTRPARSQPTYAACTSGPSGSCTAKRSPRPVAGGDETRCDGVGALVVLAPRRRVARAALPRTRPRRDVRARARRPARRSSSRHGNGLGGIGRRNSSVAFCQHMRRTSAAGTPAKWRRSSGCVSGHVESACG